MHETKQRKKDRWFCMSLEEKERKKGLEKRRLNMESDGKNCVSLRRKRQGVLEKRAIKK